MPAFLPSELPVINRVRHHWIVLLRRPRKYVAIGLLVLLLGAVAQPNPMAFVFVLALGAGAFVRWQTWHAETIIITQRRIIRVRGVPETTSSEASLRLDRISGAVLEQTVLGKILNYGTIELEAAGPHPDVRNLRKIAHPATVFLQIRQIIFGEGVDFEPDERPANFITAPLPRLRPARVRRNI